MCALRFLLLLPVLLVPGCVHVHEDSATATTEQIKAHLASQLHCQALNLNRTGKDSFSGSGKNDTGEFTIQVTRDHGKLVFQGVYAEKAKGTFSGSASWTKSLTSGFGFHKSRQSTQASTSSSIAERPQALSEP